MNIINIFLIIIVAFVILAAVGAGMSKGVKKSILTLIASLFSFGLSFLVVTNFLDVVLNFHYFNLFKGMSLLEYLLSLLPAQANDFLIVILPILDNVLRVLMFTIIYFVFRIIFIIPCFFIKLTFKKVGYKFPIMGVILLLINGILVLLVFITPILTMNKLAKVVDNSGLINEPKGIFKQYLESTETFEEGKVYSYLDKFYVIKFENFLETTKIDNRNVSLDEQLKIVNIGVNLYKGYNSFVMSFENEGLTEGNKFSLIEIINYLSNEVKQLSNEEVNNLNKAIKDVLHTKLELEDVEFEKEVILVDTLFLMNETKDITKIDNLINDLGNSKLILELLYTSNIKIFDAKTTFGEFLISQKINNSTFDNETKTKLFRVLGLDN